MTIMGESLSDVLNAFAAGLAGAAISKTAVAPLDRTKLLLQTQVCNYSVMSGEVERFSGGLGTMVRVAKEQGVTALWRGNTTDVLRYAPTHAFNFLFRDWFSLFMPDLDPVTQPYKRAGAELFVGGAAGVSALVLLHPFDVVRTRLATDLGKGYTRQYRGLIDCTSKTLKLGGPIHGLYCGFWVTVPSVMIFRAIYLGGYAIGKENFLPEDSGFTSKFLLAQTVTTLGGLAAYPLDTVRRRVILQPGAKEVLYKNGRDCLRRILADEGPRALYHGATVNILRSTTSALVLVIYDSLRSA
eukprot:TRINITY_DN27110_c0_g1_i1.p1 TRINITY_DN27110_c0_g1~~TRINITY_DN27110_c0_g1_i1.p1  ORF type:complete len:299 (+),score=59.41 TRINITY_DN27110_c0_g1_i1:62-958(+)